MRIRFTRAALLLAPLLAIVVAQRGDARRPAVGDMAPAFTLKTFDGAPSRRRNCAGRS